MKRISIKVTEKYEGYPLVKYLKIVQPSWTKVFAIKMIRTKNILINGSRATINYKLQTNDRLELYGYDDSQYSPEPKSNINLSKLKPLQVVYEDDQVIIVNKEPGVTVQEDEKNQFNNMNNRLLNHLKWDLSKQKDEWKPSFVHRLDRNTSGLLMGAKTLHAYHDLSKAIKDRKIDKYYLTIVQGLVPFKQKTIQNYLLKLPEQNKVIEVEKSNPKGKVAISEITLVQHNFDKKESTLKVKLITGRTHQIRVHLSSLGFPIRGDQKYGIEKDRKQYPHPVLTAYKLHFSEDLEGESIQHLRNKVFRIDSVQFNHVSSSED